MRFAVIGSGFYLYAFTLSQSYFFAVFVLCIAYAASLPSLQENDDEALDLELRSILNHLEEEQETRAIESGRSAIRLLIVLIHRI